MRTDRIEAWAVGVIFVAIAVLGGHGVSMLKDLSPAQFVLTKVPIWVALGALAVSRLVLGVLDQMRNSVSS